MLAAFFDPLSFRGTFLSMPYPPSTKSVPPSHQIRISPEKSEFDAKGVVSWWGVVGGERKAWGGVGREVPEGMWQGWGDQCACAVQAGVGV